MRKKQHYTTVPVKISDLDAFVDSEFSFVAVRDGVSIANIFKFGDVVGDSRPISIPDYETFVSLFAGDVQFINHSPVPAGTEWNGESFVLPDYEGFELLGTIENEPQ
jgi:hypothetical protein